VKFIISRFQNLAVLWVEIGSLPNKPVALLTKAVSREILTLLTVQVRRQVRNAVRHYSQVDNQGF